MNETDLWLLFAGTLASSVNAAAGGGTLLSFPSLIAAGLSPLAANATSTVGLLPGSLASVWAYRKELWALKAEGVLILIPALLGGAVGAWALLHFGNGVFVKLVPALLIFAASVLAAQPWLSKLVQKRAAAAGADDSGANATGAEGSVKGSKAAGLIEGTTAGLAPAVAVVLFISVYAGYFGAGAGILFLGAMGLVLSRPLGQLNALKVLSALAANGIGAATLILLEWRNPSGALSFRAALPLAIGAILGGYGGVHLARKLPAWALRAFAAGVGLVIAVWIALR